MFNNRPERDERLTIFVTNLKMLGFDLQDTKYVHVFQNIAIQILGYDKEELDKTDDCSDKDNDEIEECDCAFCQEISKQQESRVNKQTEEFRTLLTELQEPKMPTFSEVFTRLLHPDGIKKNLTVETAIQEILTERRNKKLADYLNTNSH